MKCDRLSLVKRRGEVKSRRSAFAVSILINGTTPRISRRSLLIDDLASLTHIFSCVIRHTCTPLPSPCCRVNRDSELRNIFANNTCYARKQIFDVRTVGNCWLMEFKGMEDVEVWLYWLMIRQNVTLVV